MTSEPLWVNVAVLCGWALLTLLLAGMLLRTSLHERTTMPRLVQERHSIARRRWRGLQPRIVLSRTRLLFAGLILLAVVTIAAIAAIGGKIWFSEQQQLQADSLR